jgi:hypothetical protein
LGFFLECYLSTKIDNLSRPDSESYLQSSLNYLAIANIVLNFNLIASDKTKEPFVLYPNSVVGYPKDGLFIKAETR